MNTATHPYAASGSEPPLPGATQLTDPVTLRRVIRETRGHHIDTDVHVR